jgi:hypothetical protein
VGLFPECIVTRTVSIKACARHRRRGDRALFGAFISWHTCTLKSRRRIASTEIRIKRMSIFKLQHGNDGPQNGLAPEQHAEANVRFGSTFGQCLLYPQKRTLRSASGMSALCQKPDITQCGQKVVIRSPRRRSQAAWAARSDRTPWRS